jgi:hypothetical protein
MSFLSGPTHLLRVRVPLQVVSRSTGGLEDPFMVRKKIYIQLQRLRSTVDIYLQQIVKWTAARN